GRQHAHLAGTGGQLRRPDRGYDAGDGPGESVVSQPGDRVRGEETVRSSASPGVVVEAEPAGFASPGGAALRRAGCLAGAAPRRQAGAGEGEPQACGGEAAAHCTSAGCDSRGLADRPGADAAPLPHQASVLGLLRTGPGDAQQRRLPLPGRATGARQEAGVYPRLNRNHNHDLKNLFKSAATTASALHSPFREFYEGLLAKGMQPAMARLTLPRKIAAITLSVWKKGESFDAEQLKPQAA